MKLRFTIGGKIITGFGVLLLMTLFIFALTKKTLDSSREITDKITQVHSPSVDALQELKIHIERSRRLINNWVNIQTGADALDKQKLNHLSDIELPYSIKEIEKLSKKWTIEEKEFKSDLFASIDTLSSLHSYIKSELNSFESYEDPIIQFTCNDMIEEGGNANVQTDKVIWLLDELILRQRDNTAKGSSNMNDSFDRLEFVVLYLGIALVLGGIVIALFTTRTIVRPVRKLRDLLLLMGKGIIPEKKMEPRTDEIGEMSVALNDLMEGFKRTAEFAREVGAGNFESAYKPLSDNDSLGHSLLNMRTNLFELTSNLEQKVEERTEEIEEQKKEIEVLYNHVTDSIKYAKRIQEAMLPPDDFVKRTIPNSFILYLPKDIVSGDFYWIKEKDGKVLFAAVDCTGHGVPGAFMTIVGHNGLNQALNEATEMNPADILDALNIIISEALHAEGSSSEVKDGMDAAICIMDFNKNEIEFAGAYNPLYLIRNGTLEQVKGNKFPIGAFIIEEQQKFTNHKIKLHKGDTIYIFSDGYADQFGGKRGKKFMYRNFRELLLKIQGLDMSEQKNVLNKTMEEWRGDLEQVDDILIIGLRI